MFIIYITAKKLKIGNDHQKRNGATKYGRVMNNLIEY